MSSWFWFGFGPNCFPIPRRFKEFKEGGRKDYREQRGKHGHQRRTERTEANIAKIRELIEGDARLTIEVRRSRVWKECNFPLVRPLPP